MDSKCFLLLVAVISLPLGTACDSSNERENPSTGQLSHGTGGIGDTGGSSSTSNGAGASDSAGSSGSGATVIPFACTNETEYLLDGQKTGLAHCENGIKHRVEAIKCPSSLPRQGSVCSGDGGCSSDSECGGLGPYGHCTAYGTWEFCECHSGCVADSDCKQGEICVCDDPVGHCAPAGCTQDSDCESGSLCLSFTRAWSCGEYGFACQTSNDQCGNNDDCTGDEICAHDGEKRVCDGNCSP